MSNYFTKQFVVGAFIDGFKPICGHLIINSYNKDLQLIKSLTATSGQHKLYLNPTLDDNVLMENARNLYQHYGTTFEVINTTNNKRLFFLNMCTLESGVRKLWILPAKVCVYSACDLNGNGELTDGNDGLITDPFGLGDIFGSELLYHYNSQNIVDPFASNNFNANPVNIITLPQIDQNSIPTPLECFRINDDFKYLYDSNLRIKFAKKFNLGYNLDIFFGIMLNNSAQFKAIKLETKTAVNHVDGTVTNSLVVKSLPRSLYITHPKGYALYEKPFPTGTTHPHHVENEGAGFTFKVNTLNIKANEIVRFFVDNNTSKNTMELKTNIAGTMGQNSFYLPSFNDMVVSNTLQQQLEDYNDFLPAPSS